MAGARRRPFLPADPKVGFTLADLTDAVADMHALGLPDDTRIRCTGALFDFDMADGPLVGRLTACPPE